MTSTNAKLGATRPASYARFRPEPDVMSGKGGMSNPGAAPFRRASPLVYARRAIRVRIPANGQAGVTEESNAWRRRTAARTFRGTQ